MSNNTNENNLTEKLEYIGLDLDKIPDILTKQENLEFKPSKTYKDNEYKIYQYIPISKIQILITPKNRLVEIKEKYEAALPLNEYLKADSPENIEEYATFLKMLSKLNIEKLKQIQQEQEHFQENVPFKVKYNKNYEWQIYYSEFSNKYFMLVPSEDMEYECLFYLIKKQIEFSKSKKDSLIYVPINHIDFSNKMLRKSEISELENYLWLFTKNWPITYEVYNKEFESSLQIVGEIIVYDNVKSQYKIILDNKEEALKYFNQLKALFILETELQNYYKFEVKINTENTIQYFFDNREITYNNLPMFISEQYSNASEKIKKIYQDIINAKLELEILKQKYKENEQEFLHKQKEVATYIMCKKTFIGKIKYYFKKKKDITKKINLIKREEIKTNTTNYTIKEKENYSIEDLTTICYQLDKLVKEHSNILLDINALEIKNKIIAKKVENVTLYIEEIEKHKKSIFEFWKFATKDEQSMLEEGTEQANINSKKIKRTFNYVFDLEDLGIKQDKLQRQELSKEQQDSIYIASTKILKAINIIRRQSENNIYEEDDDKILQEILENLKQEITGKDYYLDSYDLFRKYSR